MKNNKLLTAVVVLSLILAFFVLDVGQYLQLEYLQEQLARFQGLVVEHPLLCGIGFFVGYVVFTGLSLPGAAVLSLLAGALFGLLWGTVLVSFASTIGATLAFLLSRYLFRDWVQQRFGPNLATINQGVEKEGGFYLFTIRLVPIFLFFVVNLVMGLTPIRTKTFYWVSQLGMLPATLVFVNAGTQLSTVQSTADLLSPALIGSFALLGIFPLLAKRFVDSLKVQRVLRDYPRPQRFDHNLVVIGAGSGGLVASYIAAATKAKVVLIERDKMGGDCLNTGCVPSKALIRSARFVAQMRRAEDFGIKPVEFDFEFADVMDRVHRVIKKIEPHDSVERYTELGVECIAGEARVTSPYEVEVNGRTLSTRSIVIATGAKPFVPPIPGLNDIDYLTSNTIWELRSLPARLLVLGGGPIGCELAQSFQRLGSQVTLVEMAPRLLIREDPEIAQTVVDRFVAEGVDVQVGQRATEFNSVGGRQVVVCESIADQTRKEIQFDAVLVAVGRAANSQGFGLEELGIELTRQRTIAVDEYLRTNIPTILACGDVAGPYQFTHSAAHQAWYASVNALFGRFRKFKVDYSVIPWATFTEPEVARVGLNEIEAIEQGIPYEVTTYGVDDLDRAIADSADHGIIKVLTVPGRDRILGATIVAEHAGDLIIEYIAAMRHGYGMNKILGTIHIYPTMVEANRYAAGNWKRAHAPATALRWVERYHAWNRN